jgi:hypothetical protein
VKKLPKLCCAEAGWLEAARPITVNAAKPSARLSTAIMPPVVRGALVG